MTVANRAVTWDDVLTIAFNERKDHPKGFDKSDGLLVLKRRAAKK